MGGRRSGRRREGGETRDHDRRTIETVISFEDARTASSTHLEERVRERLDLARRADRLHAQEHLRGERAARARHESADEHRDFLWPSERKNVSCIKRTVDTARRRRTIMPGDLLSSPPILL